MRFLRAAREGVSGAVLGEGSAGKRCRLAITEPKKALANLPGNINVCRDQAGCSQRPAHRNNLPAAQFDEILRVGKLPLGGCWARDLPFHRSVVSWRERQSHFDGNLGAGNEDD
jgi:hypothetical protein